MSREHSLTLVAQETVTKSGDLAARSSKANKEARLVERKVCFVSEAATWEGRADSCPKTDSPPPPPPTDNQRARAFTDRGRGLHAETAESALTVIFKWSGSGLNSFILIVFSTVNLQFQGQFVPISLRPILRIVAAYVMLQPGHHVVNFFHLVGISASIRQLTGYGSEYDLQPLRRD